ncbi:MFS transporter (plasmid) [Streptomyces sp. CA-294286]|uniref:MFS transporter n=1 Tax=Streptomyces sp. CA-294286 TaxID=3240070 RepID=UPI003D928306
MAGATDHRRAQDRQSAETAPPRPAAKRTGPSEVGPSQARPSQARPSQAGPKQTGTNPTGVNTTGQEQADLLRPGPPQAGPPPPGHPESGSTHPPSPTSNDSRGTRNTVVLLALSALTNLADGIAKIALPVLATRLTDSPALISLVALTLTLPWLLLSLPVGLLVDRADRRRLLWLANGVRLLAIGLLGQAAVSDSLSIATLAAAGAALGAAEVVAQTSESALLPALVPRAGRERANAWITGVETAANEFCGPMVGGLLLAGGTGIALGVSWIAYFSACLLLFLLAGRFRAAPKAVRVGEGQAAETHVPSPKGQLTEGLRYLWRHRLLRTMALILTVLCAAWGAWLALMPLLAKELLHLTPQEYGVVLSALGMGGLTGALTVTAVNRLLGRRWAMFADLLGTLAMMAVPALTTQVWAVATAAFLGGMGGTLWTVNARLISQNIVPDALMGRYSSAARLLTWGGMPLGAALIGLLAEWCGTRTAFLLFALAVAGTVPAFLRNITKAELGRGTHQGVTGPGMADTNQSITGTGVAGTDPGEAARS